MGSAAKGFSKSYSEEDVTNVYSAILSIKPKEIANSLFYTSKSCLKTESEFVAKRKRIAESRISSIMNLMKRMQPNFENSTEHPIKPWDPTSIKSVKGKSWPSVLGMRVIIPKGASKSIKACYVSNLLTAMTQIQ